MKTIFRCLSTAALVVGMSAVGVLAQDVCADTAGQTELSDKFTANYNKTDLPSLKIAIDAGKEFLEKYGACPTQKELVDYYTKYVPGLEKKYKDKTEADKKGKLYERFNNAHSAKNWDELYAAGKEVLAQEPDNLDVILTLGSIGYDESFKKNFKYNDDTLRYAKLALQKMNAGTTSKTYGLWEWTYNNKDNAAGWMNMSVAYITYYAQNNKKDALPSFYAASLANSDTKKNPIVYEAIGRYYYDQASALLEEIKKMVADAKDTDPDDVKTKKAADIKAKVAMLNGTAERAIDAYARSYSLAKGDTAKKAYADAQYEKIKSLYSVRFPDKPATGVDAFITAAVAKPMPDPTSAITPIEPEIPATTTSTSSSSTSLNSAPDAGTPAASGRSATAGAAKTTTPAKPAAVAPVKAPAKKVVAKRG
jgi:hypothetical protein